MSPFRHPFRRPLILSRRAALVVAAGVVLAPGLAAGCGGKVVLDTGGAAGGVTTGPAPIAACLVTTGGIEVCEALLAADAATISSFQSGCTSSGGMEAATCPTDNLLGTCTLTVTGITLAEAFYPGGGITASTAQQSCMAQGGSWTAP